MQFFRKSAILIFAAFLLGAYPCQYSFSAEKTIKVIAGDAEVKKKPDLKSATLTVLPVGTELAYEVRAGEWFKVVISAKGKKNITGYIHKNSIEETGLKRKVIVYLKDGSIFEATLVSEDQEKISLDTNMGKMIFAKYDIAKMERISEELPVPEKKVIKPTPIQPQQRPAKPKKYSYRRPRPKAELGFFVAGGGPCIAASSIYYVNWYYERLTDVVEQSAINLSANLPVYFEGTFSYFPKGSLGFRLSFGYLGSKIPTMSDSEFSWTWDGVDSYSESWPWRETSEWMTVPMCVDLAARFGSYKVNGYVYGGLSVYYNELAARSFIIFGDTYYRSSDNYQQVDAAQVPIVVGPIDDLYYVEDIPKYKWVSFGGNIGAGIDIMLSKNLALAIEGSYYYSPSKSIRWEMVPGWYSGLYGNMTIEIAEEYVDQYSEDISLMNFKPSFYKISGGIKICF